MAKRALAGQEANCAPAPANAVQAGVREDGGEGKRRGEAPGKAPGASPRLLV